MKCARGTVDNTKRQAVLQCARGVVPNASAGAPIVGTAQAWEWSRVSGINRSGRPMQRAISRLTQSSHTLREMRRALEAVRRPEEIPRVLGLSLVGTYLAGLFLMSVVVWRFHSQSLTQESVCWADTLVNQVATAAVPLIQSDVAELRLQVSRLSHDPRIAGCVIVSADGDVLAANRASLIGEHIDPKGSSASWAQKMLEDGAGPAPLIASAKIHQPGDEPPAQAVLAYRPSSESTGMSQLWLGGALAVLTILLALLLVYRALRHTMAPTAAIRRNLLSAGQKIGDELDTLRVSSELGELAEAWNRMLDLVAELREQLAGVQSRRDLVRALEQMNQARGAEIIEALPDGLLLVEEGGTPTLMNQAARRLLGVPAGQMPSSLDAISDDEELSRLLVRLASRGGRLYRANVNHTMQRDGIQTTLLITILRCTLSGESEGTLIVLRDVSQQKQAERARDDFLHQVTHELRTPLSNIRAYTETLMEGIIEDKEAYRECLNVINTEARRLGRLVEDVLQASQLEVGAVRLHISKVDFSRLVQQSVQDLQATADERNIELRLTLPPKLPPMRGDKERLAVVFSNLIGNALKYTNAGGHVNVECRLHGNLLEVAVRDDGIGMASDDLPYVFEKFYRSKSPDVQGRPGTGLGLATARQIIRLHGGDLSVTSELGHGSCFTMTLPIGESEEISARTPAAESAAAALVAADGVNDDPGC